ncbi:MAG: putative ABC transporter permease [Defluviitaleaceae bacterium]|nr:putative ABC transporter permease [Defluviitaleaceae bacterium]
MIAHNNAMLINFLIYGALGWCLEVLWTGLGSLIKKDTRLTSTTSIWMFFIYGMAAFLEPIIRLVIDLPLIARGGIYVLCIFAVEYITGRIMKSLNICPWDYSGARFSVHGVIRLDYAPVWFFCGLLFEFTHLYIL